MSHLNINVKKLTTFASHSQFNKEAPIVAVKIQSDIFSKLIATGQQQLEVEKKAIEVSHIKQQQEKMIREFMYD